MIGVSNTKDSPIKTVSLFNYMCVLGNCAELWTKIIVVVFFTLELNL